MLSKINTFQNKYFQKILLKINTFKNTFWYGEWCNMIKGPQSRSYVVLFGDNKIQMARKPGKKQKENSAGCTREDKRWRGNIIEGTDSGLSRKSRIFSIFPGIKKIYRLFIKHHKYCQFYCLLFIYCLLIVKT